METNDLVVGGRIQDKLLIKRQLYFPRLCTSLKTQKNDYSYSHKNYIQS